MGRQIEIIFDNEVVIYLDNLLHILYKENYFSDKASAKAYVIKIYSYIEKNITVFPKRKTPEKLIHLGSNYIFYNSTQRTTWFIFFEQNDDVFSITGILNNHVSDSNLL